MRWLGLESSHTTRSGSGQALGCLFTHMLSINTERSSGQSCNTIPCWRLVSSQLASTCLVEEETCGSLTTCAGSGRTQSQACQCGHGRPCLPLGQEQCGYQQCPGGPSPHVHPRVLASGHGQQSAFPKKSTGAGQFKSNSRHLDYRLAKASYRKPCGLSSNQTECLLNSSLSKQCHRGLHRRPETCTKNQPKSSED